MQVLGEEEVDAAGEAAENQGQAQMLKMLQR